MPDPEVELEVELARQLPCTQLGVLIPPVQADSVVIVSYENVQSDSVGMVCSVHVESLDIDPGQGCCVGQG